MGEVRFRGCPTDQRRLSPLELSLLVGGAVAPASRVINLTMGSLSWLKAPQLKVPAQLPQHE